ncbi:MAG: alpha/beta fold hydrolase [Rubrivivax sp.]|nr:alpha/beta fold hydrolase [Rubrivivax sp.]
MRPAGSTRGGLRGLAWVVVATAAALLLPGCAWLDLKQRQIALRPTPGRPAGLPGDGALFRPGDERFSVPVPAVIPSAGPDHLSVWWLPHADPDAPTLLYLHGTFRNLYRNLPKIDALRAAGFAVVAVDYRGWGESTPIVPSEETIAADARRAWAEVVRRQPQAGRRVIFGHSMGGAVAVRLASGLHVGADYGALVLESTFTRLPEVAASAGFWGGVAGAVATLDFNALERIGRVDAPLLMLHGSADKTVPVALGRRLRDAAPPGVRWVEVPGGSHSQLHRDAPDLYRRAFTALIGRLAPPATASRPPP